MNWITEDIAIGSIDDVMCPAKLLASGVEAVLSLNDFPAIIDEITEHRRVSLIDGAGNNFDDIVRAVSYLDDLCRTYRRVLVHCNEGKSRSAVVVAVYVGLNMNISFGEAMTMLRSARPGIGPNRSLIDLGSEVLATLATARLQGFEQ